MANDFLANLKVQINPHVPDILFGMGCVGVVGGTIMACFATAKLPKIIQEHKDALEEIMLIYDDDDPEGKKELRREKLKFAWKVTVNFGPAACVELMSLISQFCGYKKVRTVAAELAATCAAYDTCLKAYRARVKGEVGEEKENDIWLGQKTETVQNVTTDENGVETVTEEKQSWLEEGLPSMYARWFYAGVAEGADFSLEYNRHFLESKEKEFNVYLGARKIIYLNDIYKACGIKPSIAGNRVGWIYNKDNLVGDKQINLRIQLKQRRNDFGELVWSYLIDPNVDGVIDDLGVKLNLIDE